MEGKLVDILYWTINFVFIGIIFTSFTLSAYNYAEGKILHSLFTFCCGIPFLIIEVKEVLYIVRGFDKKEK